MTYIELLSEPVLYVCPAAGDAQIVRSQALNFFGKPLDFYTEDFFAKCIHHEVEHLQGKIYLDRLSSIRRSRLVKQIKMVKKKQEQNLGK